MSQLDDALGDFFKGVGVLAVLALITQASRQPTPAPQRQPAPADPRDMGIILCLLGRHAEALPHLDLAVSQNPNDTLAHLCMGYNLLGLGRRLEALHSFDRAVSLDPNLYKNVPTAAKLAHKLGQPAIFPILAELWYIVDLIHAYIKHPPRTRRSS